MLLSIVIPAYNEEQRIGASLQEIQSFLPKHFEQTEVIVVNDGSSDKTSQVVTSFVRESGTHRLLLVELPQNSGKGAAVKAGVERATGDFILFMDADLSTPLTEISKVLSPLQAGKDIAIGSRATRTSNILRTSAVLSRVNGKNVQCAGAHVGD